MSIVLCCHNSTDRLENTLYAILNQDIDREIPCELVLVDNASTDGTASFARTYWDRHQGPFPLRVVFEPTPGLMNARRTGIDAALYDYIVFCDDDNHLSPEYVRKMYEHLENSAELAAVGGMGVPLFESDPPSWFPEFASSFATGSQCITCEDGRVLNLYGAGLGIRKSALQWLYHAGYTPLLSGRKGKALSSSEDTEMTYALAISGYRLDYDDSLRFLHYIPKARLTRDYLERLILSSGEDGPIRNLYHAYASNSRVHAHLRSWIFHLSFCFVRLFKYLAVPPKRGWRWLFVRWNLVYMKSLWKLHRSYKNLNENILRIPRRQDQGVHAFALHPQDSNR
jgi:glycosyltransferase involved in cell wall biosynthesis